jgi:signal transduction histidine kinase
MMLTCGAVLLINCTTFVVFVTLSFRRHLAHTSGISAEVMAANSAAALVFRNEEDATEILASLARDPHAVAACLYDENGHVFATYPAGTPATAFPAAVPDTAEHRFRDGHFLLFQPVLHGGDRFGTLYLKSDLEAMYAQFRLNAVVALVVAAGSVAASFALSISLRRRILQPILRLAETARHVSERKDYGARAPRADEYETGRLTDAFNEMLVEIQKRDETLQKLNEELERRVAERTADLEASTREMEAFSYSVSHDLRAPLRAIDGFSKALLDDQGDRLDAAGHGHLQRVRAATGRMGALIDDLLRFARTSRVEIRRERVDLGVCATRVVEELRQADPQRASNVSFVVGGDLAVEGDSQLLTVVIDNLVRNAWKFTAKHPRARIEIGSARSNGNRAFFVRDDGAGFDMMHSKQLFKAFQRLHRQTDFEGTGIGLATVHRVIERHRGRVWAEAAVERGATFYFTLWEDRHE